MALEPKLAENVVLRPKPYMAARPAKRKPKAAYLLQGWLFWSQLASPLGYSRGPKQVVADQIACLRLIQNFNNLCAEKNYLNSNNKYIINFERV